MKALRFAATLLDLLLTLLALPLVLLAAVVLLARPWRMPAEERRILVIDSAYSLSTIRARMLERFLKERDLDGYFDHVYTYHPLVGASPDDPGAAVGPLTQTPLEPRHTMLESHIGLLPWLSRLPKLNFLLAQSHGFCRVGRLVRREGVSIVRAHDPMYLGLFAWPLARLNRRPLVIFIQGNYDHLHASTGQLAYPRLLRSRRLEMLLSRWILRRADLVTGVNQNNTNYGIANGARPERATVFRIGNSIDPYHFSDPTTRPPAAEGLPPPGAPFVAYVGRLETLKHPDDVVRAFAVAHRRHPDLYCLLVGDGSIRKELEDLGRDLGIHDRLYFAGNRPQPWIADALPHASAILAPLIGRSLVEGALSGTPIVAYDVEWHSELVVDGETGILVPYRNWQSMGERIHDLLCDPETAERLGRGGRAAALHMMDPARIIGHEREVNEKLITRLRASRRRPWLGARHARQAR